MNITIVIISLAVTTILFVIRMNLKHELTSKQTSKYILNTLLVISCLVLVVTGTILINNYFKSNGPTPPKEETKVIKKEDTGVVIKPDTTSPPPVKNDDLAENEIEYNGSLKIRVLKDKKPIPFTDIYVSSSITEVKIKGSTTEYITKIEEGVTQISINCKLSNVRWLLDRYKSPEVMPNYDLEVNNKIIPSKYHTDSESGGNKNANYDVLLKRQ